MIAESPQVLVVHGDADSRQIYSMALLHYGITVITAVDGAEGLRLGLATRPKLVLVDADGGVIDSAELVNQLRTALPHATLVRVRFSPAFRGLSSDGDAGYDHVFDKPVPPPVLAEWIGHALAGA